MARDETVAMRIWYRYYSAAFGAENIFIIDHNSKENAPFDVLANKSDLNIFRIPFDDPVGHIEGQRSFDSVRFTFISKIIEGLLKYYNCVMFTDVDEIYIPDPNKYDNIYDYVVENDDDVIAGVGLEIFHDLSNEPPFDPASSVLMQRRNFTYKFQYSKPHIVSKPCRIGPHGSSLDFRLDPDLYLLHLKYLDWNEHLLRQEKLFGYFCEGRGGHRSMWRFDIREAEQRMEELVALPRGDGFEHHMLFARWLGDDEKLMIHKPPGARKPGQANVVQLVDKLPPKEVRAAERVRRTLPGRFRELQV